MHYRQARAVYFSMFLPVGQEMTLIDVNLASTGIFLQVIYVDTPCFFK